MLPILVIFFVLPYRVLSQLEERYSHGFHSNNLTINGAAHVLPNGILKVTNDSNRVKGHAFHPTPFRFKSYPTGSASSFSTAFAFSTIPEFAKLGGHGFAFALSPTTQLSSSLPSQYLGLLNKEAMGNFSNHLFAVEFDTVQDFEFGDISDNHIGVDLNSLVSNKSVNASYFLPDSSLSPINLKSGQVIQAWIDYDAAKKLLEVRLSPDSPRPNLPILSYEVDLSPILQELMYVGFSGSTGLLASSHNIFGWTFTMNGTAKSLSLSSLPSLPKPKKSRAGLVTGLSVASTALLFLAIGMAVVIVIKLKNADIIEPWELQVGPHRFSYKELKKATQGFSNKALLGFGGFGKVYHGVLLGPHNNEVAVKRISHESRQGLQEFVAEIASIGRLRHKNLVRLLGWCRRRGDLLLVYEFMPNGSLDKLLFDNPEITLNWNQRFNIIKGVAYGLLYLHEEWEQTVIHRDIKAGNVLLDSELNGRLGDFGLAKLYEHGTNPSTTRVVGTLGYLAPELTRIGKPTTSSDVFAFGALLLEVACGRRPIEPKSSPDDLILVDWVWEKWKTGEVKTAMDCRINGDYDEEEALTVVKLGLMCMNNLPELRPPMRQAVKYLEGEVVLPETIMPPNTFEERLSGLRGALSDVHFEDYVNSYQSSFLAGRRSTDGEASLSTQMSLTYTNECR